MLLGEPPQLATLDPRAPAAYTLINTSVQLASAADMRYAEQGLPYQLGLAANGHWYWRVLFLIAILSPSDYFQRPLVL